MNENELKDYLDARLEDVFRMFEEKEKASRERQAAIREQFTLHQTLTQRALDKAETSIDARLEGMNELRSQIQTERGLYVTRDIFEEKLNALSGRLDERLNTKAVRLEALEKAKNNMDGRLWMLGAVMTIVTTFIVVVVNWVFSWSK